MTGDGAGLFYENASATAFRLGTGLVSIGAGGQVTWWLSFSDSHTIANAFSLSGGTLHSEDAFNTFAGLVTLASGTSTISARYEDSYTFSGGLAGSGNVLFTQAGGTGAWAAPTFVLSAANSNSGSVRVTGSSGGGATRLRLANVNALQNATLDLAAGDQGTVEFTVAGTTTYSLGGLQGSRNLALGGNSLSIGGNNASTTYSGVLSGSGGVTKTGRGNLVLAGANTFAGATTVSGGRLSVDGSLATAAVTVQSGAALGGSGSIAGSLAVNVGGTLSPGNSIESLAAGATTFSGSSTFAYEYDSTNPGSLATAADLLVVSGSLSIAPGSLLTLTDITSGTVQPLANNTTVFAMVNYSGGWNGGLFTYSGDELADGELFSVGGQQWQIDYDYTYNTASPTTVRPANYRGDYLPSSGTQTFVAITAVPEPSIYCLALAGLACGGYFGRRRRKRA